MSEALKCIVINLDSHPADARIRAHLEGGRQWVSVNGVVVIDGPADQDWVIKNRDGVVLGAIEHNHIG